MLQCKTKWKKKKLKDICSNIFAGGTPSTNISAYWENGQIIWLPSGLIQDCVIDKSDAVQRITELGLARSSAKIIKENTTLLAMTGATCGKTAFLTFPAAANQSVMAFETSEINPQILYYLFQENKEYILRFQAGGAQAGINKSTCSNFEFYFPIDKEEQDEIVNILSTCDEVIEKTEETIEKYKQIKAGMMQDLFNRGLDSNGKLRPTYAQNPDLYKYSKELDRYIPKEWDVKNLSILGEFKNGLNKEKKCFGHGTKFVNIIDAYKEYLDIDSLDRVETNNNDLLVYSLKNNDLIFVRSSVKPEGVGYNTIFLGADEPVVYCGFMIRFRLYESDNINAQFLNYYFRSDYFRRALIAKSTVSANTNINQDSLNQLYTILPKKKEQNKIVDIIDNMNKNISFEEQYLNKYKQIKQGLMKRLLTPPADAEIVEE